MLKLCSKFQKRCLECTKFGSKFQLFIQNSHVWLKVYIVLLKCSHFHLERCLVLPLPLLGDSLEILDLGGFLAIMDLPPGSLFTTHLRSIGCLYGFPDYFGFLSWASYWGGNVSMIQFFFHFVSSSTCSNFFGGFFPSFHGFLGS